MCHYKGFFIVPSLLLDFNENEHTPFWHTDEYANLCSGECAIKNVHRICQYAKQVLLLGKYAKKGTMWLCLCHVWVGMFGV